MNMPENTNQINLWTKVYSNENNNEFAQTRNLLKINICEILGSRGYIYYRY